MKTAVVVVDMVKDNLESSRHAGIAQRGQAIVPLVNRLTAGARAKGWPVIFATDSFLPGDYLFRGRMKDHSLRGTEGAEVSGLLTREPQDTWLPKRRMSAFSRPTWTRPCGCGGGAGGRLRPDDPLLRAHHRFGRGVPRFLRGDGGGRHHRHQRPGPRRVPGPLPQEPLRPLLTVQTVDELLSE